MGLVLLGPHGCGRLPYQGAFDPAATGPSAALWTGESGLLTAITLVVVTALMTRRPWHPPGLR